MCLRKTLSQLNAGKDTHTGLSVMGEYSTEESYENSYGAIRWSSNFFHPDAIFEVRYKQAAIFGSLVTFEELAMKFAILFSLSHWKPLERHRKSLVSYPRYHPYSRIQHKRHLNTRLEKSTRYSVSGLVSGLGLVLRWLGGRHDKRYDRCVRKGFKTN
ncbi:hypothetical protein CLF_107447 [Clonorchis sinensis]|uniref:Uncharacterized protein n=1 Tax=Clonorchis sinensis TaxID=79923 RepID=G7YQL5_CLOSI|nr:hypothetical protein CLF_107447 [Clonorchis sinensis]